MISNWIAFLSTHLAVQLPRQISREEEGVGARGGVAVGGRVEGRQEEGVPQQLLQGVAPPLGGGQGRRPVCVLGQNDR